MLGDDIKPGAKTESEKYIKEGQFPINQIKSNHFRVIHVDGARGSMTPSGNAIQMVLFNHRVPIPQVILHKTEGGAVKDATEKVTLPGFVREMEVAAIMNLETATVVRDWLSDRIKQLEEHMKANQKPRCRLPARTRARDGSIGLRHRCSQCARRCLD